MAEFTFDPAAFRLMYPAFASESLYPDATLQMYWDAAGCYIANDDIKCGQLQGQCRFQALNLLTAHLLFLGTLVQKGQTPGIVTASSIDKISVSLLPPPVPNAWAWWLNGSPYGAQLLALLSVKSVGGVYIGGLPERSGFRRVGGGFGGTRTPGGGCCP